MKKILLSLLLCLFPFTAMAAGTCVETYHPNEGVLHLECTAAAGAISWEVTAASMAEVTGKYLRTVTTYPGGTAPTDASDLGIADDRSVVIMAAGGNGANLVDATTTEWDFPDSHPADGTADHFHQLHQMWPITVTVTNNAVGAAVVNIDLEVSNNF